MYIVTPLHTDTIIHWDHQQACFIHPEGIQRLELELELEGFCAWWRRIDVVMWMLHRTIREDVDQIGPSADTRSRALVESLPSWS